MKIFKFQIFFFKSPSKRYSSVMDICQKFNNFSQADLSSDENILTVGIEEFWEKYMLIQDLWDLINNWSGVRLALNGKKINTIYALDDVLEIIYCNDERQTSIAPDVYCYGEPQNDFYSPNNTWGCRFLCSISALDSKSFHPKWKEWYKFGFFQGKKKWVIDKAKIIDTLSREANKQFLYCCPFFSMDRIKDKVLELPDCIDLSESAEWQIVYETAYEGSTSFKRPIEIAPKLFF